ncbi:hypothetical protein QBC47DRAFT_392072 [Echria macrotheca]|uniref:Methyltransferase domain-containing protein n=1 Tax=Echria macrotheca TaxID=438768 RepID=A0AAJ0B5X9_9PEZI|nr:hypothetical protein QBC47DRAFT_392072 [Echria macrotheca]
MPEQQETSPAGLRIGSKDRSVGWYDPPLTSVEEPVQDLLQSYSGIPPNEVLPRVIETRDKIWEIFPWPCVGQFRFLDLSLIRKLIYPEILARLQSGDRILDVGCCFAQDLRKLAHDGAPRSSLYGLEKQSEFIDLAYDFFGDKETFGGKFIRADLLDRDNQEIKALEGTFGIVQLGMVLHIWDIEGQIQACERVVELLRDEKGVLVVGQSVGSVKGKEMPARGRMIYKHDPETFANMWEEVGRRTGTQWVVRASLDSGLGIEQEKRAWDEPSTRRLSFEVERI